MAKLWADQYRELLIEIIGRVAKSHGFPTRMIDAAETRLGFRLPDSLRDYYLTIGRHPMNRIHNRLLPPDALEVHRGRLVFMEENQWVYHYGVRVSRGVADPFVVVTDDLDEGRWQVDSRCSRFLSAMLGCQAVFGALPNSGYADSVPVVVVRRLTRGWTPIGSVHGMSTFVSNGRVVGVTQGDGFAEIDIAARTRREYESLIEELGVEVHDR